MRSEKTNLTKYLIAFWCMLEILFFGGIQYGWASLVYVLKREGFFAEECGSNASYTNTVKECDSQDAQLSFLYTISSGVLIIPVLFYAFCTSRFSIAKTRVLFTCIFVLGGVFAIVASPENPWLVSASLALLGGGGRVFFLTSLQLSSQLEKAFFIVSAAMSGCYDSSAAVMLIVKILFDAGIGRRISFAIILGLSTTTLLNTYLNFTTVAPTERIGEENNQRGHTDQKSKECILKNICKNFTCNTELRSHIVWFCMIVIHVMFIFSSSHIYIKEVVKYVDNTDASSLTNFLSVALMSGFVPALVAGLYLELFKLKLTGSDYRRNVKTLLFGIVSINILSIASSVLGIFYSLAVVYTTFFIFPVLRGFFYSVAYTYIVRMLPEKSIGVTSSLLDVLACTLLFSQKAIIIWLQSYDHAFLHIRITFAVMSLFAMFHPIVLWIRLLKRNAEGIAGIENQIEDEKGETYRSNAKDQLPIPINELQDYRVVTISTNSAYSEDT